MGDFVDMISQEHLQIIPSDFTHMSTWGQGQSD